MELTINKNFEEYKDNAWRGFSVNELVVLLVAAAQAGVELYLFYAYIHIELATAVYIVVPSLLPVLALGFFKYQNMTPFALLKELLYEHKTRRLFYAAGEQKEEHLLVFSTKAQEGRLNRKERKAMKSAWKQRHS